MDGGESLSRRRFLTGIESVRGIAALYVAFGHCLAAVLLVNYKEPIFRQTEWRDVVVRGLGSLLNAETAVVVFFVLSGLVIGLALDGRGPLSRSGYLIFLIRRALRLYPARIVATVGVLALAWLFLFGQPPVDFSPYPKMNPGFAAWFNGDHFKPLTLKSTIGTFALLGWHLNLVVWSLYVEMTVAFLLPVFHVLSRRDDPRLDAAVLAALLAVTVLGWGHVISDYWFVFYLGMLVPTWGRRWTAFIAPRLGVTGALVLTYLVMACPDGLIANRPSPVVIIEAFGAFSLISLIAWGDDGRRFRVLDHPLLRWNGRLSYSFYLWHLIILTVLTHALYAQASPAFMSGFEVPIFIAMFAVSVALALTVAHVSYRWVERPFIRLGYRVEQEWTMPAAPVAVTPLDVALPVKPTAPA
jgi:peptidoglycan/LPS O-acetylase OafA/YrhL